jgi:hypothetical protein
MLAKSTATTTSAVWLMARRAFGRKNYVLIVFHTCNANIKGYLLVYQIYRELF